MDEEESAGSKALSLAVDVELDRDFNDHGCSKTDEVFSVRIYRTTG